MNGTFFSGISGRWLAFAVACLICHHWWPILAPFRSLTEGTRIPTYIDLITPVAVVGTAAWAAAAGKLSGRGWALFVLAAIMYVEGHGIHLAANSINNQNPSGDAATDAHFWDEVFGHVAWYTGWTLMTAVLVWSGRHAPALNPLRTVVAALLGFTVMTNAVEGAVVPMILVFNVLFLTFAFRVRRGLARDALVIYGTATVLLAIFGIWQGGFPEFSELGWL
jgi:hypothetical protein